MIYECYVRVNTKSHLSGMVCILDINNRPTIHGLTHLKHDNRLERFDPLITHLMIDILLINLPLPNHVCFISWPILT